MTYFAVIGDPIKHTLSPKIHNFNFKLNQDESTYDALRITAEELPNIRNIMIEHGLIGINVTIPHKETIIPYLDEIAPEAKSIGAVNTVHFMDGKLIGYNTDVSGFKSTLLENFSIEPSMNVLILGGGGAAKAVHYVFHELKANVTIAVRNVDKLERFSTLPFKVEHFDDVNLMKYDCIINATPLGLNGEDVLQTLNILPDIKENTIGIDLIYNTSTPFLGYFKEGNYLDGLGMLVHQAMDAYTLWSGKDGNVDAIKEMLKKTL